MQTPSLSIRNLHTCDEQANSEGGGTYLQLEVLLEKIKLMKDIFLYDIELGNETFIPRDLS